MGDQTTNWMASTHMGYLGSGGSWLSKPTNFGLTNYNYYSATTNTGAYNFFVNGNGIYIQQSYTLHTQLNNVSTWTNKSLASLGLADGTYTWSWAGDSFSVVVGTPVPEPATYGLALGGLALAVVAARGRRRPKD